MSAESRSELNRVQRQALMAAMLHRLWRTHFGVEDEKTAESIVSATMRVDPKLCSIVVLRLDEEDVAFAKSVGFEDAKKGLAIFRNTVEEKG